MGLPKTIWEYSRETEAARVVNTAAWTANRFFSKYGFLVLPRLVGGHERAVYLPELDYDKIPNFWKTAARIDPIPLIHNSSPISKKLEQIIPEPQADFQQLQNAWKEKESKFWETVFDLFPLLKGKDIELKIKPTEYGVGISFSLCDVRESKLELAVWCRVDQKVDQLAEGILSSILMGDICGNKNYSWEESEAFIDLLFAYTKLQYLFPDHKATLAGVRSQEDAKLVEESAKYLQSLGLVTSKIFDLVGGRITKDGESLDLTNQEFELFKLLLENQNQLVSLEQIADQIWKDNPDKFSEWAITKMVQRLRNKLRSAGVSPELIQTRRGVGYLLIN